MLTSEDQDLAEYWIHELTDLEVKLNSYELGFLESVADQFERTRQLTQNQFDKLKEIYEAKS